MSSKQERIIAIREVIRNNIICNQEELLNHLTQKGFSLTQATLSRDMKQLKIIKSPDAKGNYIYTLQGEETGLTSTGFISIEFSHNLAVIKTRPGYAMGIASDIDNQASHEILGTIAGDDTILLIPREGIHKKDILNALSSIIPNL